MARVKPVPPAAICALACSPFNRMLSARSRIPAGKTSVSWAGAEGRAVSLLRAEIR
jgi:hypothetical protein